MADIAYEVQGGVYKIENSAIQQAFQIAGITVTSVLNGDSATMTLKEDVDGDGVAENQQEFTLTGGTETFDLAGYEVKQDNEIWVEFDFEDDGNIADAGRIEDVTFQPENFILGLTEIQNYIEDDWNDNRLTDRQWRDSDIDQGVFAHPDTNEAGDTLIGRYRPEWDTPTGSPYASNGKLQLPIGDTTDQNAQTTSNITTGSWSGELQSSNTITTNSIGIRFIQVDGDNYATVDFTSYSNELTVIVVDNGSATTIINSTWGNDTAVYNWRQTRSSYGEYELLLDGVSQGTATSNFDVSNTNVFRFTNRTDATVTFDNLVIN